MGVLKRTCLLLLALMFVFGGFAESSEAAIRMKLGSKQVESHQESIALKYFAEKVKERTNGEIVIDLYFGEVLGDAKKQIENMIHGMQDFYADGYGFYAPYVPEINVSAVPYIFRDNDHYRKYLLSDMQQEIERKLLEKAGLRIVNRDKNWLRGPYRVVAAKTSIETLDDLKGLKIRQPSNPTSVRAWETLGCAVTVIPYSETYLALKQGTVDAVTCPVTDALFQKFCEVAPFLTISHEYPQQVAIVMNERRFQSLTKEQQDILFETLREAGDMCTKMAIENGEILVKEMVEKYGVTMLEIDLDPWREKMAEFIAQLEKENYIPAGYVEKIKALR